MASPELTSRSAGSGEGRDFAEVSSLRGERVTPLRLSRAGTTWAARTRDFSRCRPVLLALFAMSCYTTLAPTHLGDTECLPVGVGGVEYAVCATAVDHAAAAQDCEHRGAHLLDLATAEEDAAVATAVFSNIDSSNVWIGGAR